MEEICVLVAGKQQKGLKKFLYERKTLNEMGIVLNIYTVNGKRSIFSERRIKKICSMYTYIYSSCPCFFKYCKGKPEKLINYLPGASIAKIVNFIRFDTSKENIGLVIKNQKFVNINFLTRLLKNVKYISCYNPQFNDTIMETTGICPFKGKDLKERLIIYLDKDIYFLADGKLIYDVAVSLPHIMQDFKNIPAEAIICDCLKVKEGEKIMKDLKLNISELVYT